MKFLRISLLAMLLPLFFSFVAHKFYVSTTKIEYSEEEQSLQLISKFFIDDMEEVLRQRYDKSLTLGTDTEGEKGVDLIKKYTLQKFSMAVNGSPVTLNYLGHEYDNDIIKMFIEVENISELKSITVTNSMLTELFEEQQNIVHVKRYKKRKSLVLDGDNPKGTLNF